MGVAHVPARLQLQVGEHTALAWRLNGDHACLPRASDRSVAVFYADEYSSQPHDAWAVVASSYWARVLVPLTLFIVPLTDLLWMGHLPK